MNPGPSGVVPNSLVEDVTVLTNHTSHVLVPRPEPRYSI